MNTHHRIHWLFKVLERQKQFLRMFLLDFTTSFKVIMCGCFITDVAENELQTYTDSSRNIIPASRSHTTLICYACMWSVGVDEKCSHGLVCNLRPHLGHDTLQNTCWEMRNKTRILGLFFHVNIFFNYKFFDYFMCQKI